MPAQYEPKLEFAFTVKIALERAFWIRPPDIGCVRAGIYLKDGTFEGPNIRGIVIPGSGADWPLVRPNGVIDFDARYMLQEENGVLVLRAELDATIAAASDMAKKLGGDVGNIASSLRTADAARLLGEIQAEIRKIRMAAESSLMLVSSDVSLAELGDLCSFDSNPAILAAQAICRMAKPALMV